MPKLSKKQIAKIKARQEKIKRFKKYKKPKYPHMIELEYSKAILREVNKLKKLTNEYIRPELKKIIKDRDSRLDANISGLAVLSNAITKVKSVFYDEKIIPGNEAVQATFGRSIRFMVDPFMQRTNKFEEKQFIDEYERQTGTKPLDLQLNVDEFIKEATDININLIKTIPSQYFSELQTTIESAVRRGQMAKDIEESIDKLITKQEGRAKLIARDQISKLAGSTNQARQIASGVEEYIWRTMEDSRVRSFANTFGYSDHKRLDGTLQRWDSPPVTVFKGKRTGERNHPSEDIQCRCYASPVYDSITGREHPETIEARKKAEELTKTN